MPWNPEHYSIRKPKVIHTRTFSCADDHPIVWYTFDKDNKAMCDFQTYKSKDWLDEWSTVYYYGPLLDKRLFKNLKVEKKK